MIHHKNHECIWIKRKSGIKLHTLSRMYQISNILHTLYTTTPVYSILLICTHLFSVHPVFPNQMSSRECTHHDCK